MEYGIYEAYLKQPEKFFAPACPLKLGNRMKSKKVQTSTPPQETLSSYYSMLLTQLINAPSDFRVTPEVPDDPEIKLYLKEHQRWKNMQKRGFIPQPLLNEWFDTEENKNPILNKVNLTLPILPDEQGTSDKLPKKLRANSISYNTGSGIPSNRGTGASSIRGVPVLKLPDLNYEYIRPKSKKYTEYLNTKRKPQAKGVTVSPQTRRIKPSSSPTKSIMNLTFSDHSPTVTMQSHNIQLETRQFTNNQENFEEILNQIKNSSWSNPHRRRLYAKNRVMASRTATHSKSGDQSAAISRRDTPSLTSKYQC
jgi:hypothetical protein